MDQTLAWSAMTCTVARQDAWSGRLGVNPKRRALRFVFLGMFFRCVMLKSPGAFVPQRAVAFFPVAA